MNGDIELAREIALHLAAGRHAGTDGSPHQLILALRQEPGVDERFVHAVRIMVRLIPRGLKGVLGVQGHLLGSVAKEFPREHQLLYEAIKSISQGSELGSSPLKPSSWLEFELDRAVREKWCMDRGCTTCGSFQMVELLTGRTVSGVAEQQQALRELSWGRSREVVSGLRDCSLHTSPEAIMWMLHRLWLRWGNRAHEELFPELDDTFAGGILTRMREHYAKVLERRRQHELRQGVKNLVGTEHSDLPQFLTSGSRRLFLQALLGIGCVARLGLPVGGYTSGPDVSELLRVSETLKDEPLEFAVIGRGELVLKDYDTLTGRWSVYDVAKDDLQTVDGLCDLIDRIDALRYPVADFREAARDGEETNEAEDLDDWDDPDMAADYVRTLPAAEFTSLVSVLSEWFDGDVDSEEWDSHDVVRPIDGRQWAFQFFSSSSSDEMVEALDIELVEGDSPGSNYFAAELGVPVEEANRIAKSLALDMVFAPEPPRLS